MCVTIDSNNNKTCFGRFPYQFNEKLVNDNITSIQDDEYLYPFSKSPDDPVSQLAVALGSLLIFSLCLIAISIGMSLGNESAFSKHVTLAAIPDLLVMVSCGVIMALVVYGYPKTWAEPQFFSGAYLMYAAFGARVMSHPMVTKVFLKLLSTPLKICCGRPTYVRYVDRE
jgi:hypothetical protein